MRDTLRLRTHLALLACLPLLPGLASGCDDESDAQAAPRDRAGAERSDERARSASRTRPRPTDAADRVVEADPAGDDADAPAEVPPEQQRFLPIAGDPPFIDGYNPEEETCVSGNWCGTIETAMTIAPNPEHIAKEMDCPIRIIGAHNPSPIKGAAYQGLSTKNSMQGSLNQHGTELARADGKADTCCYHWFEYCSGRPLRVGDETRLAEVVDVGPEVRAEGMWADRNLRADPIAPPAQRVREALAAAWLEDARAEHASVAAFARATLELMSHGAPPELLQRCQRAGLDEIEHARRCFGLASRFAGRAIEPGPLPAAPPRTCDLAELAADTFVEGCVGETVAALVAERALARTSDEGVRQTLEIVARDEAEHAALAWRTIRWALDVGGRVVADRLRLALAGLQAPRPEPAHAIDHPDWAHFGRLTSDERQRAAADAMRDIVAPLLQALLGDLEPRASA